MEWKCSRYRLLLNRLSMSQSLTWLDGLARLLQNTLLEHPLPRPLDFLDNLGRIPRHDDIIRNIPGHNTPRPDGDAVANRYARQHDAVTPKPAVLADGDGFSAFGPPRAVPQGRVDGMRGGVKGAAGADQCPRPDSDEARVEPGAVEVDKDAFSES